MPIRILIAAYEPQGRLSLKAEFARLGYLVVGEAPDGMSAIDLACREYPDLAILDVDMPGLDGITAAETLTREQGVPVIFLTTSSDPDLLAHARDAGVIHYVVKPWRPRDLQPAIETTLARFRELQSLKRQVRDLQKKLSARMSIEHAKRVVMKQLKLPEQEAFIWLQKQSKKRQKPMREIAETILLPEQLKDV